MTTTTTTTTRDRGDRYGPIEWAQSQFKPSCCASWRQQLHTLFCMPLSCMRLPSTWSALYGARTSSFNELVIRHRQHVHRWETIVKVDQKVNGYCGTHADSWPSTVMFNADGFYFTELFNYYYTITVVVTCCSIVKPVISIKTILNNVLHSVSWSCKKIMISSQLFAPSHEDRK